MTIMDHIYEVRYFPKPWRDEVSLYFADLELAERFVAQYEADGGNAYTDIGVFPHTLITWADAYAGYHPDQASQAKTGAEGAE